MTRRYFYFNYNKLCSNTVSVMKKNNILQYSMDLTNKSNTIVEGVSSAAHLGKWFETFKQDNEVRSKNVKKLRLLWSETKQKWEPYIYYLIYSPQITFDKIRS